MSNHLHNYFGSEYTCMSDSCLHRRTKSAGGPGLTKLGGKVGGYRRRPVVTIRFFLTDFGKPKLLRYVAEILKRYPSVCVLRACHPVPEGL